MKIHLIEQLVQFSATFFTFAERVVTYFLQDL